MAYSGELFTRRGEQLRNFSNNLNTSVDIDSACFDLPGGKRRGNQGFKHDKINDLLY